MARASVRVWMPIAIRGGNSGWSKDQYVTYTGTRVTYSDGKTHLHTENGGKMTFMNDKVLYVAETP